MVGEVGERHGDVTYDGEGRAGRLDSAGAGRRDVVAPRDRDRGATVAWGDRERQLGREEARQTRGAEIVGSTLVAQGARPVRTIAVAETYNRSQWRR